MICAYAACIALNMHAHNFLGALGLAYHFELASTMSFTNDAHVDHLPT